VGQNPPDNASEDPSKKMDYTTTIEWKQGAVVTQFRVQASAWHAQTSN